jgi:hypothetical protein
MKTSEPVRPHGKKHAKQDVGTCVDTMSILLARQSGRTYVRFKTLYMVIYVEQVTEVNKLSKYMSWRGSNSYCRKHKQQKIGTTCQNMDWFH